MQGPAVSGGGNWLSAVGAGLNWWQSLLHRGGAARGDMFGGFTAAIVMLAVEGSYGLLAFSFLGVQQAQLGFVLGVLTAAVASAVTLVVGARGPLLSGSSAALALLVPSLLGAMMIDVRLIAADGQPMLPVLLAFAALGVVLAGVIQLLLALTRLGGLVRYVPYPVHAGYMNAVAVLMVAAMSPHLLGLPYGDAIDWRDVQPLAPLVALVGLVVAIRPPAWTRPVPAYLTALLAATATHHLLALTPLAGALGPYFDTPRFEWPGFDALAPLANPVFVDVIRDKYWLVLQFAVAVAFVSSLQTALAGATIDELSHQRRERGRELVGQGFANVIVGFIGGLPSAAAVTRSKINLDAGARTAMSRAFFALGLMLALVLGLQYMRYVPMAAIAGVFVVVAYALVDAWTRRATAVLWRQSLKWRMPLALAQSYAVMLIVAAIAIFVSLPIGIGAGMLVAVLMFIRSNIKQPLRQVVHADTRTSRKVRPAHAAQLLRTHGKRIVLIELDGALFFGTAETADEQIERLIHVCDYIVLDFEHVTEVDASGARVLLLAADAVQRAGKQLLLAGLAQRDPRTRMIRDMDVHGRLTDNHFFSDADHALEYAEDRLLAAVSDSTGLADTPVLSLQQALGANFDSDEVQLLASMMSERRYARGDVVFRSGEPGDSMYLLVGGQIGIWLSGGGDDVGWRRGRRLVSYAPGVLFGEMGLLAGSVRSADAIVESDALMFELSRTQYQKLQTEYPTVLAKLLLNVGLQLAGRVRSLTDELRAAQSTR